MAFHHRPCPLPSPIQPGAARDGCGGYLLTAQDDPDVVSALRAAQEQTDTRGLRIVKLDLAYRKEGGPEFRNILLACTVDQGGTLTGLKILCLELGDHWQCLPLVPQGNVA
jgi:hypothetical protein